MVLGMKGSKKLRAAVGKVAKIYYQRLGKVLISRKPRVKRPVLKSRYTIYFRIIQGRRREIARKSLRRSIYCRADVIARKKGNVCDAI